MRVKSVQGDEVQVILSQGEIRRLVKGKKFYSGDIPGDNTGHEFQGVDEEGRLKFGSLRLTPEETEDIFSPLTAEKLGTQPVR